MSHSTSKRISCLGRWLSLAVHRSAHGIIYLERSNLFGTGLELLDALFLSDLPFRTSRQAM